MDDECSETGFVVTSLRISRQDIFRQGTVSTVEQAKEVVKNIGFPVMIKASEGGRDLIKV